MSFLCSVLVLCAVLVLFFTTLYFIYWAACREVTRVVHCLDLKQNNDVMYGLGCMLATAFISVVYYGAQIGVFVFLLQMIFGIFAFVIGSMIGCRVGNRFDWHQ